MWPNQEIEKKKRDSCLLAAEVLLQKLNDVYESDELMERHVSNAFPVAFTQEFQQLHSVGPYGRKTIKGDNIVIHAAPVNYEQPMKWCSDDSTQISAVHRYVKGGNSFSQTGVPHLTSINDPSGSVINRYEQLLLESLREPIVLHNPSNSALWAARNCDVIVDCPQDDRRVIEEEFKKMSKHCRFYDRGCSNMMFYLGTNSPRHIPSYVRRWISFTPNPQRALPVYESWICTPRPDGYHVTYVKKARLPYDYIIPFRPLASRFSAETTDKYLGISERCFMLETNQSIHIDGRSTAVFEDYMYLDGHLPQGTGHLEDLTHVWDVPGPGTYLSRRPAIEEYARQVGKVPIPLLSEGCVPVGLQTEFLSESTMRRHARGFSTCPVKSYGPVINPKCVGFAVSRNPTWDSLSYCPGLHFCKCPYDPIAGIVDCCEPFFFFCRSLVEISARLPAIISLFLSPYRKELYIKPPPEHWSKIVDVLGQAAERELTLGETVKEFGIPSASLCAALYRSTIYGLIYPTIWRRLSNMSNTPGSFLDSMVQGSKGSHLAHYNAPDPSMSRKIVLLSNYISDDVLSMVRTKKPFRTSAGNKVRLRLLGIPFFEINECIQGS